MGRVTTGEISLAPSGLPETAILPAVPDADFDRIARLARRMMATPMAAVTLVTREVQVFPGAAGMSPGLDAARTNELSYSVCRHVVSAAEPLIVPDTHLAVELVDTLAVTELGIRAYVGMPLFDADDVAVGSLCVTDSRPRTWSDHELAMLAELAEVCTAQLQLRELSVRAAVSGERDRIGTQLHRDVIGALFQHAMMLSNARSHADGDLARQLGVAVEDVDAIIVRLRNSIYEIG